jgi:CubicO group peptidase (beta-lactamase class C family)
MNRIHPLKIAGVVLLAWSSTSVPAFAAEAAPGEADTEAGLLFLSQDEQREAFAEVDEMAPTLTIHAGATPRPLPPAEQPMPPVRYEVDGETFRLEDFLARESTMGVLIVRDGRILLEHYADGHDAASRWVSFSVTKSVTSMLIGAAMRDGYISSLDEPVSHYLPRLRGTGYENVTIEQVLHMASGIAWNEDYADPQSDVARAGGANGLELVDYLADLPRAHPPGEVFNYNTGETNLGGEILRAALGNNASTYLEHRIWQPFGMAADADWMLGSPGGGETGGCCISATLRDYARIGLFALADGQLPDGTRVLPEGWMDASTTPSPAASHYGYQWWLFDGGAFAAMGIFGQRILVDPELDLVMAVHGNAPSAVDSDFHAHLNAVTQAIRQALR